MSQTKFIVSNSWTIFVQSKPLCIRTDCCSVCLKKKNTQNFQHLKALITIQNQNNFYATSPLYLLFHANLQLDTENHFCLEFFN